MGPDLVLQSPAIPPRLGKYEIVSELGTGGMARVFLAVHRTPVASKVVVLKHVRIEFAEDSDFAAMFMDEARVAVRLNHRNVIHAYEASSSAGQHYLAMEFLEGKTLSQLLRAVGRAHIPLRVHLWILCQVLSGLHYAHGLTDFDGTPLGIVHRDVSPSNVFVTRTGEVKLIDFGIAKLAGAIAETKNGIIKGKIGYASPEQCFGRAVDARTDVYSVGVMLWEALARRRQFSSETARATLQGRPRNFELDLAEVRPMLPEALLAIARNALSVEPEQRYPSAAAFLSDLTAYVDALPGPAPIHLAAQLMRMHFASDFARVRQAIERHLGAGSAPAIRSNGEPSSLRDTREPTPAASGRSARGELPQAAIRGRLRTAWPWSVGAILLLATSAWGPWRYAAVERQMAPAAASNTPPAPSAARAAPTIVVAVAPPKPVLVSELPLEAPRASASPGGGIALQRRAAAVEPRRPPPRSGVAAPPAQHVSSSARDARAPSATPLVAVSPSPQLVEPGVVLTRRATRSSTYSLDEKDPFLP